MTKQQEAAVQAMRERLAHPQELGKAPAKLEIAGEFDLHDGHYYILKYIKSLLGKWLAGVCGFADTESLELCGPADQKLHIPRSEGFHAEGMSLKIQV